MSHRAHYQTPYLLAIVQMLALAMPVAWWVGRHRPPPWTVWLFWALAPLLLLLVVSALIFAGEAVNGWKWKRRKRKL